MDLVGAYERPLTTNHFSMRATSLLASFALFIHVATAQDCVVQELPQSIHGGWTSFDHYTSGEVVGTIGALHLIGDIQVVKLSTSGEVLWQQFLSTTDGRKRLVGPLVLALSGGGAAIYGDVHHMDENGIRLYTNKFIIRLTNSGEVAWARYFMDQDPYTWYYEDFTQLAELASGDLIFARSLGNGVAVSRIGETGEPIWNKRFANSNGPFMHGQVCGVSIGVDGGVLVAGTQDSRPFAVKLDQDGQKEWAYRYSDVGSFTSIRHLASGDLLLGDQSGQVQGNFPNGWATRLTCLRPDGTVRWKRGFQLGLVDVAHELSDGKLVVVSNDATAPVNIVVMDPEGMAQVGWSRLGGPVQFTGFFSGTGGGDELIMGFNAAGESRVLRSGFEDLSCILNAVPPVIGSVALPDVMLMSFEAEEELRNWTMSLGRLMVADSVDLIVDVGVGAARPGFQTQVHAQVANLGARLSGPVIVELEFDPTMEYASSYPEATSVTGNRVRWEGAIGLEQFQVLDLTANFLVPATTPLGTLLTSTITATQDSAEVTLVNNAATWVQEVTGSYDPNDKLVRPEGLYHFENDSLLDYTIRFQNTGTDTAFTVVIADTLAAYLDVTTFKPGAASHPYTYSLTGGGLLTFTFANILLPDSNVNEARSHGLVKFSIKPHAPIAMGQAFVNRAYIYFDFNEPIITPDAVTVVGLPTRVTEVERAEQPHLYPVPAKQAVTVVLPQGARAVRAWLLSPDGRRSAVTADFQGDRTVVSVAHLATGVHFLQLVDRSGRVYVVRFVKE